MYLLSPSHILGQDCSYSPAAGSSCALTQVPTDRPLLGHRGKGENHDTTTQKEGRRDLSGAESKHAMSGASHLCLQRGKTEFLFRRGTVRVDLEMTGRCLGAVLVETWWIQGEIRRLKGQAEKTCVSLRAF